MISVCEDTPLFIPTLFFIKLKEFKKLFLGY